MCAVCLLTACAAPRQSSFPASNSVSTSVSTAPIIAPNVDELSLPWREAEGVSAQQWQENQQQNLALLADDPNHPEAHAQLADIYFKHYILAQNSAFKLWALYHSQKALNAKPHDLAILASHYRLMYTQIRLEGDKGQLERLQKFYRALPEAARTSFFPPSLAFYLYQLDRNKNNPQAVSHAQLKQILQQALHEQPRNALIHVQLSRYFFDAQQIDVAFAILQQAHHLEPENPQVLLALAEAYRIRAQRAECVYEHLDDLKRSTQFYKQLLSQQNVEPQVHWGLMVNYAHLGLAPLSIREGEQAMSRQNTGLNKWSWATFLTYQNQAKRAEELFLIAKAELPKIPTRALVEHYVLLGQWQKAAQAFGDYIGASEQPGVMDLLLASMIQVESQDKSISVPTLWRTQKKAVYFNAFDEALAKFWRSEIDEQIFATFIKSSCQQAEFEFYVGYLNLLNNRIAKAKVLFETAQAHQQPMNFEVQMAAKFLQSLLNNRVPNK
jgi:hypothetical protein